jgi:hypothetical protein
VNSEAAGHEEIRQWLMYIDDNKGAICEKYLNIFCEHFDDLQQVAKMRKDDANRSLPYTNQVEVSMFETLGVERPGHRMAIAKSICKLAFPGRFSRPKTFNLNQNLIMTTTLQRPRAQASGSNSAHGSLQLRTDYTLVGSVV